MEQLLRRLFLEMNGLLANEHHRACTVLRKNLLLVRIVIRMDRGR